MKKETVKKFENLNTIIAKCGEWWRFEQLVQTAKDNHLEIPCESTIRKYYNIEKRIFDFSYDRYTRYDGKDLREMYEDEEEFEAMTEEEKINNYLVGTLDEEWWEDEYGDEFDYWYDNGTYEKIEYKLGEKRG